MTGTFDIAAKTPMGEIEGVIEFVERDGKAFGKAQLMGEEKEFEIDKNGDNFCFSTSTKIMMMDVNINIEGKIDGETLVADAKTNFGTFKISGKKQ